MARRYFVRPLPPPGRATLSSAQGHFLGRIIRTAVGDSVVLFDGAGREVAATVVEVGVRKLLVDVGEELGEPRGRSPRIAVDIACALPKKSRIEWLLEHGTEVGVRSFRPILTERTNRQHERRGRWEQVLIAACAQSDRAILPNIEPAVTLEELCALPVEGARYVATEAPSELAAEPTGSALLVVGPEGGLTEREVCLLESAHFLPRSLGPLTLRTETAVLAGATRLLQAPAE